MDFAFSAAVFLMMMGFFTAMEIFARRGDMPIIDRVRGLQIWLVMAPLGMVISSRSIFDSVGISPIVELDFAFAWAGWLAVPLATFFAFLWLDFFFYWYHRAQHRFGFLWRFHAVHHSIENLSAINSYRHWVEPLFWAVMITLPMALIDFGFYPRAFVATYIFTALPTFIHSNTRVNFGAFRWLLIDNCYHRIHHSADPAHRDLNFGALSPFWDVLFGTAYFPRKGEWPVVGLVDNREPRTIRQWALQPWSRAPSTITPRTNGRRPAPASPIG